MHSRCNKNNTSDAVEVIRWNDAASPFRIYNNGIIYEKAVYKSPMHVLVAIVYGTDFFNEHVLHNYDPKFIAQNFCHFCGIESDADFVHHLRKTFCIEPAVIETVIDQSIELLTTTLFEQRPLMFNNITSTKYAPEIMSFCRKSKLMLRICTAFAKRCYEHKSMLPLT